MSFREKFMRAFGDKEHATNKQAENSATDGKEPLNLDIMGYEFERVEERYLEEKSKLDELQKRIDAGDESDELRAEADRLTEAIKTTKGIMTSNAKKVGAPEPFAPGGKYYETDPGEVAKE